MAISNNNTGIRTGVCTSTTRPTAPYEGQHIYETDTDLTYIWGGSAWQQVSGGTAVGNSGLVYVTSTTFTGSTVDVSNCFTSTYDTYRIVCRFSVGTSYLRYNLLASGSPIVGGSYYSAGFQIAAIVGTLNASVQAATTFYNVFANSMAADAFFTQDINYFPTARSMWTTVGVNPSNADTETRSGGYHSSGTTFDGFRLTSGATMTGKLQVYGYRKA